MPKPMHLAQYLMHSPTYHSLAMWRHPRTDRSYDWRQPELYQHIARVCERGKLDMVFFADFHYIFDAYQGSPAMALQYAYALAAKLGQPLIVVSAIDPLIAEAAHARMGSGPFVEQVQRDLEGFLRESAAPGASAPAVSIQTPAGNAAKELLHHILVPPHGKHRIATARSPLGEERRRRPAIGRVVEDEGPVQQREGP